MKNKQKTIVLASGGTGGHMFPAAVLSDELLNRKYKVVLITDERGKRFSKDFSSEIETYVIKARYFKKGVLSKIGTIFSICLGIFYALKIMLKFKPVAIVSFGGYASFPTTFAGFLIKVPIVLHEQNAILGRANRFMLPFAKKVATSFHGVKKVSKVYKSKVTFTGNPVSKKIEKMHKNRYPSTDKLNILITGGSQGAKTFGKVVPKAVELLTKKERDKLNIVQQVIEKDIEKVEKIYKDISVKAEISSFFYDMDKKLKEANLFIGRSGALTTNELLIVGRPSILVPLVTRPDGDQNFNASVIADGGAGWIMQEDVFTPQKLADRLKYFIKNPDVLKRAGSNAKEIAVLNAGENLANVVELELKK